MKTISNFEGHTQIRSLLNNDEYDNEKAIQYLMLLYLHPQNYAMIQIDISNCNKVKCKKLMQYLRV